MPLRSATLAYASSGALHVGAAALLLAGTAPGIAPFERAAAGEWAAVRVDAPAAALPERLTDSREPPRPAPVTGTFATAPLATLAPLAASPDDWRAPVLPAIALLAEERIEATVGPAMPETAAAGLTRSAETIGERAVDAPAQSVAGEAGDSPSISGAAALGSADIDATAPRAASGNRAPAYPDEARRRRQEGVAVLALDISNRGAVTTARVERSSGFALLDAAALEAARSWRFEPAMRRGAAEASVARLPVRFSLR